MLRKIAIQGFSSFENATADLGPMNVLIGPNGAGKSNLIKFLRMMGYAMTGGLQNFVGTCGGASTVLHYGPKKTTRVVGEISITGDGGVNDYRMEIAYGAGDTFFFADEQVRFTRDGGDGASAHYRSLDRAGQKESALTDDALTDSDATARVTRALLRRVRTFQFHDTSDGAKVKQTAYIGDNKYLRDDAGNLAPFLFMLRESAPKSYATIRDTVRLVAPFFDDFVLEPTPLNKERIKLEWKSQYSDEVMSANQLSDGTLRFIALATLFKQTQLPDVICIDEPELGLHPLAVHTLVDLAYETSLQTQIILATQSVPLVDAVQPSDILTVEQIRGATGIQRLDEDELQDWLKEYRLSDLWERNIIGGRPQP